MALPPLPQAIDTPGGAPSPHDAGDRGDTEYAYREPATIRPVSVGPHIALNEHFAGDGATIFKHACMLGCEGIVSKRLGSSYRSSRVDDWVTIKNPAALGAKRKA